jgi:thiol-disulfide isomerase/thioredoxin
MGTHLLASSQVTSQVPPGTGGLRDSGPRPQTALLLNLLPLPFREGKRVLASGVGFLLLTTAAQAAVKVVPADAPTIKKAIAAQKGHVVLVNFWATWCAPCVAEFPAIVTISRRDKARGLIVIAVSADSAKDLHTKVEPFLAKQKVKFPVYLERSADPEDFINAFDTTWQGDLPRTFIYDRQGHLVKTLSDLQTTRTLAAALRPYLGRRARKL